MDVKNEEELSKLTRTQLRRYVSRNEINIEGGISNLRKTELIKAIVASDFWGEKVGREKEVSKKLKKEPISRKQLIASLEECRKELRRRMKILKQMSKAREKELLDVKQDIVEGAKKKDKKLVGEVLDDVINVVEDQNEELVEELKEGLKSIPDELKEEAEPKLPKFRVMAFDRLYKDFTINKIFSDAFKKKMIDVVLLDMTSEDLLSIIEEKEKKERGEPESESDSDVGFELVSA